MEDSINTHDGVLDVGEVWIKEEPEDHSYEESSLFQDNGEIAESVKTEGQDSEITDGGERLVWIKVEQENLGIPDPLSDLHQCPQRSSLLRNPSTCLKSRRMKRNPRPYKCDICSYRTITIGLLTLHEMHRHKLYSSTMTSPLRQMSTVTPTRKTEVKSYTPARKTEVKSYIRLMLVSDTHQEDQNKKSS